SPPEDTPGTASSKVPAAVPSVAHRFSLSLASVPSKKTRLANMMASPGLVKTNSHSPAASLQTGDRRGPYAACAGSARQAEACMAGVPGQEGDYGTLLATPATCHSGPTCPTGRWKPVYWLLPMS